MFINTIEEMALYLYNASPRYTKELHEGRKERLSREVLALTARSEEALLANDHISAAAFTQQAGMSLAAFKAEILILKDFT